MYAILSGGLLISLCDKPRYIRKNEKNGVYIESTKEDSIGISVHGNLYNFTGKNSIPDAPEAIIVQGDVAEYVFHNQTRIINNEESANAAIIEMENALCDIDTHTVERLSILEDALCELDSTTNGGCKN